MFKKILAATLSIVMLIPTASFAEVVNDEKTGKIIYTDDFNNETPRKINSWEETRYTSDVFDCPENVSHGLIDYGYSFIREGEGPDLSNAVVFEKRIQSRFIVTREMEVISEDKKVYEFSYDIKVSGNDCSLGVGCDAVRVERNTLFSLNPGGLIKTSTDGTTLTDNPNMTYEPDKWYHIFIVMQGKTKKGWMYDDEGNCIYSIRTDCTQKRQSPFFIDTPFAKKLEKLTLDNAKIVEYLPENITPSVVTEPSVSGKSDVRTDTHFTTVTFNSFIDTESTATLISKNGKKTLCRVVEDTQKPYTYKILLPALAANTYYKLDLSTIKNSGGKNVDATYSFSTVASPVEVISKTKTNGQPDLKKTVSGTAVYTGFNRGDKVTVSLKAQKEVTADIVIAYYNSQNTDTLVKVKKVKCSLKKGTSNHTITLDENVEADYAKAFVFTE